MVSLTESLYGGFFVEHDHKNTIFQEGKRTAYELFII